MTLAKGSLGRFADRGEGRNKQFVKAFAGRQLLAEFLRAGAQRFIRERRNLGLQRVDRLDLRLIGLQAAVVGGAEDFPGDGAEHARTFLTGPSPVYGAGRRFVETFENRRVLSARTPVLGLARPAGPPQVSAQIFRRRDKSRCNPCQCKENPAGRPVVATVLPAGYIVGS